MTAKLILAVDLGASLTKAIYRLEVDGSPPIDRVVTFCSAVSRITASRFQNKQYADDNTALVSFGGAYWMVGVAAQQTVTITNARTLKSKDAIAKILAVVGQIGYEHDLPLNEIQIALGVLLPLDEMNGCDKLQKNISELLYQFGFNGEETGCGLVKGVEISPEGYGYSRLAKEFPAIVLVFGHRDVASLFINQKSVSLSESRPLPGWGMIKLISLMNYSFKDELGAAEAIFNVGDVYTRDKPLLRVVPPEDVERVQVQIEEARTLLWNLIWDELLGSHIGKAEQVLASGGNAFYWRPELKRSLGSRFSTGGEIIGEIQQRFPELKEARKASLAYRCGDCYAFWKELIGPELSLVPEPSSRSKVVSELSPVNAAGTVTRKTREVNNA